MGAPADAAGWLLFQAFGPPAPPPIDPQQAATNAVVLAFCWFTGIILGLSSSNLRREQLNYTLGTMGIMAHELRTPLATMQLIAEAVRNEAPRTAARAASGCSSSAAAAEPPGAQHEPPDRHADHQRAADAAGRRNAERISAAELVQKAIADYPFRSTRERQGVAVRCHGDFHFLGSSRLFSQVIDNLTKNALRSLAAASSPADPGDLLIEVGAQGSAGASSSPTTASAWTRPAASASSSPSSPPTAAPATASAWPSASGWCRRAGHHPGEVRRPPGRGLHHRAAGRPGQCKRRRPMTFPLFHSPGTVVFLDDDPDYLEMLALVLPRHWHLRLFLRPTDCIAHLLQEPPFWEADAWNQQQLIGSGARASR